MVCTDPDKMNGAGDEFGGEDFPSTPQEPNSVHYESASDTGTAKPRSALRLGMAAAMIFASSAAPIVVVETEEVPRIDASNLECPEQDESEKPQPWSRRAKWQWKGMGRRRR